MSAAVVIMPAILLPGRGRRVILSSRILHRQSLLSLRSVLCRLHHEFFPGVGGGFSPDIFALRLKQFWNRWPGFLQCEQVTTAEGVDVTTIADSRPFAFRKRPVSHSSVRVHITHCYHSSVECDIIICFGFLILFAGILP